MTNSYIYIQILKFDGLCIVVVRRAFWHFAYCYTRCRPHFCDGMN